MTELLKKHERKIEMFTMVPSDGGRFEVTVDGQLIYSKLKTHRHVESGEVADLVRKYIQEGR